MSTKQILAKQGLYQYSVSFAEASKLFFIKMFNYKSRSSLSEYWWVQIWRVPLLFILYFCIEQLTNMGLYIMSALLIFICVIPLILADIALFIRRCHDINIHLIFIIIACIGSLFKEFITEMHKAGNGNVISIILALITVIINICVMFSPSTPYANAYGPVPNVKKLKHK